MANTQRPTASKRPSTARKHTPRTEANRVAKLDDSFGIKVEGVDYVLTPTDLTGVQEMQIRRETGYSVAGLIMTLQQAPGIDLIGMFMWAVELSQGKAKEPIGGRLVEILESLSYATEVEVTGESEPDDPQP